MLKDDLKVLAGEVVDATVMRVGALNEFLEAQIERAKADDVLFSVHLKATMMKVSDPIIFGHVVRAFLPQVFEQYGAQLAAAGLSPNDGLGGILAGLDGSRTVPRSAPPSSRAWPTAPPLAMVDSDKGITNLHVPSDVIVDACMPAMIRTSGHMWGPDGQEADTLAVIPDSSYAGIYQAVIDDCRAHGAFDPTTMGSVPNVGLMAKAAEEYGSHDKTFEVPADGTIAVVAANGDELISHNVEKGDIWRACQTKDASIQRLGQARRDPRARHRHAGHLLARRDPRPRRQPDRRRSTPTSRSTTRPGWTSPIAAPADACATSIERIRRGEDTISVTGNVLRDYNTDLFPILELGTSAKMLSIVPLMNGGGLFETGAGGSAPKHVQQLVKENYLRWDSLGEFFALAASLEHLAAYDDNARAKILSDTLDRATETFLNEDRSPGRKLGTIDNRGSHFYLGLYWAEELAKQTEDADLAAAFAALAGTLRENEEKIVAELLAVQGSPADIGGYYEPDEALVKAVMRPSATFNEALASL